jgi:AcrR family transcriptional regulator
VIDETSGKRSRGRRLSRAEQAAATRGSIIDATIDCLVEDGYPTLTTRRVADRAGVAQSTLMHHFETREALLVEAVSHLVARLAQDTLRELDMESVAQAPEHREAVLDQVWREFTSPQALAAAQLWVAAWSEPELARTLRDLEARLNRIALETARPLFPALADDPRFPAVVETALSIIRGLVVGIPIAGQRDIDARWAASKPIMLDVVARLLDEAAAARDRGPAAAAQSV